MVEESGKFVLVDGFVASAKPMTKREIADLREQVRESK